jgi:hypothetical protein
MRLIVTLMLVLIALSVAEGATESSRVVPASDVLAKIEADQPEVFDNCTIVGDLNLSELVIEEQVHFNHSLFRNSVNSKSTTFNSEADFRDSKFNGDATFRDSKFNSNATFMGSTFNSDVDFRGL